MLAFALKKISSFVLTLWALITAAFFLLRFLPGGPFDQDRALAPEILANLNAKYGLDQSLFDQYLAYITKLLTQFDFGPSLKYTNRSVMEILTDAVPVSFEIGLIAFVLALVVGLSLGYHAATQPRSKLTPLIEIYSGFALSLPSFVFAATLIWIFGFQLDLLPIALLEGPEYYILPACTLAICPSAYITRVTMTTMSETLAKPYIEVARVKGLGEQEIYLKHVLRNSLISIVAIAAPLFAIMLTGSFVVEHIYALPGMGKYFVTAFINRDYFLVLAVIVIFASTLLVINILVDLLNKALDPKLD